MDGIFVAVLAQKDQLLTRVLGIAAATSLDNGGDERCSPSPNGGGVDDPEVLMEN